MSLEYDHSVIKATNLETIKKDLIGDKIIYFNQFIFDPETQTDGDGPWTTWNIQVDVLEEIEDDFVSHLFSSNCIQGISASLGITSFPHHSKHYFSKLIETIEAIDTTTSLEEIKSVIGGYQRYHYMADESDNVKLNFKLDNLSSKIDELKKKIRKTKKEYISFN
jgi:hypothetical protein